MNTIMVRDINWLGLVGVAALSVAVAGCGGKKQEPAAVQAAAAAPSEGIKTATGIELVAIPAGSFTMGDEKGDADEKPVHKIQIAAFEMDKYEVTQKRYEALMGRNPSRYKGADRPADSVSWVMAIEYCNMRSTKEGLTPCYDLKTQACNFDANGYRLPTEAEWEYACRAGTATSYGFGDEASKLGQYGWFRDNAEKATHPIGKKKPNAWGLFDMHGNVLEWCHDVYDKAYYAQSPADNPRGPASGATCVLRGGSWMSAVENCRSATRNSESPKFTDACFGADEKGFRCVRKGTAK